MKPWSELALSFGDAGDDGTAPGCLVVDLRIRAYGMSCEGCGARFLGTQRQASSMARAHRVEVAARRARSGEVR